MPGPGPGGGRMGRAFLSEEEKANRPKVTKELLVRIMSYLKPYWKQLIVTLICIAVSSTMSILPSVLTGKIIMIKRRKDRFPSTNCRYPF